MPSKTTIEKETKKPTAVTNVKKTTVKEAVKKEAKKEQPKTAEKKQSLESSVVNLEGKVVGKVNLPEELFGEKVNKTLLAQAVRVYRANKRQGNASTLTRGEVDGSTAKIYRQKGTGRARHGSKRAPIFVHGGVVFGPKPRDFSLDLPKKMKRKALFSALSAKFADGEIKVVAGLADMEPKTKQFAGALKAIGVAENKRNILVVTINGSQNVIRAAGNVPGVTCTAARQLNAYDILAHRELVIMQESVEEMTKVFSRKD